MKKLPYREREHSSNVIRPKGQREECSHQPQPFTTKAGQQERQVVGETSPCKTSFEYKQGGLSGKRRCRHMWPSQTLSPHWSMGGKDKKVENFKGSMASELLEGLICSCTRSRCTNNCSCSQNSLCCTQLCTCHGNENCGNPHSVSDLDILRDDDMDDGEL